MGPLSPYSKAGRVLWAHFTEERTEVQTAGRGLGPAPGTQGELLADQLRPLTSPPPPTLSMASQP